MKKFTFLFLALIFVFTACFKGDEAKKENESAKKNAVEENKENAKKETKIYEPVFLPDTDTDTFSTPCTVSGLDNSLPYTFNRRRLFRRTDGAI